METVEQFLARGGKIQTIESNVSAIKKDCECGCKGNPSAHAWKTTVGIDDSDYTNMRMHRAENQVDVHNAYYDQ